MTDELLAWSTSNIKQDGQTEFLVRIYETAISGIRDINGLPSGAISVLTIETPTLDRQASVMRYRNQLPPGHNPPSGVMDWLD